MRYTLSLLGCLAVAISAPTAASAVTFDLTGSRPDAPSMTFTEGDLELTATFGFYDVLTNTIVFTSPVSIPFVGTIDLADSTVITQNASGLGIDRFDGIFTEGDPPELNGAAAGNEVLLLGFNREVEFDSVTFGEVDSDDEVDVFLDGSLIGNDIPIGGPGENPLVSMSSITGLELGLGADSFFGLFGGGDDFRVSAITVSDAGPGPALVPLPGALVLLLSALGGLALSRRVA